MCYIKYSFISIIINKKDKIFFKTNINNQINKFSNYRIIYIITNTSRENYSDNSKIKLKFCLY